MMINAARSDALRINPCGLDTLRIMTGRLDALRLSACGL